MKSLREELNTLGVTTKAKTPKRTLVRLMKESLKSPEASESDTPVSPSPITKSPLITPAVQNVQNTIQATTPPKVFLRSKIELI